MILLLCSPVNTPFIRAPGVRCILKMHLSHVPSVLRNRECREDVTVIFDLLNLPFHFLWGFSSTSRPRQTHTTSSSSVPWNHCHATHSKMIACLSSPFLSCVVEILELESVYVTHQCVCVCACVLASKVKNWESGECTSQRILCYSGSVTWLMLN